MFCTTSNSGFDQVFTVNERWKCVYSPHIAIRTSLWSLSSCTFWTAHESYAWCGMISIAMRGAEWWVLSSLTLHPISVIGLENYSLLIGELCHSFLLVSSFYLRRILCTFLAYWSMALHYQNHKSSPKANFNYNANRKYLLTKSAYWIIVKNKVSRIHNCLIKHLVVTSSFACLVGTLYFLIRKSMSPKAVSDDILDYLGVASCC